MLRRFIQWLRDIFTAFKSGGGSKFERRRRGGAAAPVRPGTKTKKRARGGRARCEGCGLFVRSLCTDGEDPCGVCPDCCLGHDTEKSDR